MLAILTTHPIQYQVPLWQALARDGRIPFKVWYLTKHGSDISYHPAFGKSFAWDIDLLSGHPHDFLTTPTGASPDSFWKCRLQEDIANRIRVNAVRVVWVNGWDVFAYWQAVWAAKKIGAEVWLRGESNDIAPRPLWKRAIKPIILGKLFKRVDRFLYIGTANRRLYEKFSVPQSKLFPAPYAVDNERFARQAQEIRNSKSPAYAQGSGAAGPAYAQGSGVAGRSASGPEGPTSRWEIRRQWKIPDEAFCVLFCGKFIPKKRPLDLVKAAQLLMNKNSTVIDRRYSTCHLLFVGSGELGGQLRANCNVVFDAESPQGPINKEPITDNQKPRASFVGFLNQTEISKAYMAADCLVLPSDYRETWGLVVNEAMASGMPCIISDQCGCAEDLGALGANEVFPCGNIEKLAAKLCAIAERKRNNSFPSQLPSFAETVSTAISLYSTLPLR